MKNYQKVKPLNDFSWGYSEWLDKDLLRKGDKVEIAWPDGTKEVYRIQMVDVSGDLSKEYMATISVMVHGAKLSIPLADSGLKMALVSKRRNKHKPKEFVDLDEMAEDDGWDDRGEF